MRIESKFGLALVWVAAVLLACSEGGGADGRTRSDAGPNDSSVPDPDGGGIAGYGGSGGRGGGGAGAGGAPPDGGGPLTDPCDGLDCGSGQRCEVDDDDVATCVDMECDELACDGSEICTTDPGGGHVCEVASCDGDVDCPQAFFCDADACAPDVCESGERSCDDATVVECSDNGGVSTERFSCESAAYFDSTCVEPSAQQAACSCEDDWDCPQFTVCEVGRCTGTGSAPTCSLPPIPFSNTPPAVELHWGGDNRDDLEAHDGTPEQNTVPWPTFSQVATTPMVANLDDDNGDGLINELDFPEILFVTHKGNNPWRNGVLRAIHGGGPDKGADYFSRCGDKLWRSAAPNADSCADAEPDADSGAPLAVGDLDNDGVPEIVYTLENTGTNDNPSALFRILDNTGAERYELSVPFALGSSGAAPSIANLDFAGFAEIIVGHKVYVLGATGGGGLTVTHILSGDEGMGVNALNAERLGPMVCAADIIAASQGQEIVAGATLYRMPATLPECGSPPCAGSLEVVWNAPDVAGNSAVGAEGYCAVADVWGADAGNAPGPQNRPDGKPEVILIYAGDMSILDGESGEVIDNRDLGGLTGGAPNVDDFDGDGFLEIASALQDFYVVVDLQSSTGNAGSCPDWPAVIPRPASSSNPNPARVPGGSCAVDADCDPAAVCNTTAGVGACVCLHNGWKRDSDDDSSRATSSSVFDFNGDGASEVIYNDECDFRVYDGTSGEEQFSQVSRSRTLIENPVVADVDNDGNAEVVTGMNTAEANRCDEDIANNGGIPTGPNGVRVWGDPSDTWVSARRIWNQQSYHVTNVTEAGGIPRHEAESWGSFAGRVYNTYRSQPRNFGVAPDLTVADVGVSSPDAQCGSLSDNIDIAFEIRNAGDLRVGPGVVVRFFGTWNEQEDALLDGDGDPLEVELQNSLEPGKSVILSVNFDQDDNNENELPDEVRVVVDPVSGPLPNGAERECAEGNNSLSADVEQGDLRADLLIELGDASNACPNAIVETLVRNRGTAAADDILVRYYAGDPTQGGTALHEQELDGPLEPGEETSFDAAIPNIPSDRSITIYAVVDPDRTIEECNEANNKDAADDAVFCSLVPD
jgi:hypothetical protein